MDWRQTLLDRARALGRPVHEHAPGIGIDFEDGYDAFWVLPGEVTSTYPLPAEGPASVQELLSPPDVVHRLPAGQQHRVHQAILAWARASHRWAPPDDQPLRTARAMGWEDVADTLPENPCLLPTLLTIDRRPDQFDEPGMLSGAGFVLAWSRLSPSPFLARLVATAYESDLVEMAKEASRRSVVRKPETAKNLESAFTVVVAWHKELQTALAIAWKRCRSAGGA